MVQLVERKAIASIASKAQIIKKYNNGNHIIRIFLLCFMIFLVVQMFYKTNIYKKEESKAVADTPFSCHTC